MKNILGGLLVLLALACSRSSSTPTEPLGAANLQATVVESVSDKYVGVAGAVLEVGQGESGPVAFTATTDASGVATISVAPGSYWIRVLPPAGYGYGGAASVAHLSVRAGETAGVKLPLVRL